MRPLAAFTLFAALAAAGCGRTESPAPGLVQFRGPPRSPPGRPIHRHLPVRRSRTRST